MYSLFLDTSCDRGFLALANGEELIYQKRFGFGLLNSKELVPAVTGMFDALSLNVSALKCIGVGIGPGSYTGIRVGVAFAQGLSANSLPLITFSSLDGFISEKPRFASVIPARSGGSWGKQRQWNEGAVHDISAPRFYVPEEYDLLFANVDAIITSAPISSICPLIEEKEQDLSYIAKLVESKYAQRNFSNKKIEILYLPRCPYST